MSTRSYSERIERIKNLVKRLSGLDVGLLLKNVEKATNAESLFLDSLFSMADANRYAGEIFRGAHVKLIDSGWYYDRWKGFGAEKRRSSHDSDVQQYEIAGPCC